MSDTTALILDGARGPGHVIARSLAESGHRLVLTDMAGEIADSAARPLGQTGLACDITDSAAMARVAYSAQDVLGDLDVVVLVLNGLPRDQLGDAAAEAEFERLLVSRSRPLFLVARHLAPAMRSRKRGALVIVAPRPPIPDPWQAATVGWLTAATRALAAEWAPDGLRINTVIAVRDEAPPLPRFMAARTAIRPPVPLGILPRADDIAAAAIALCSDTSQALTGQVLHIDGGAAL